MARSFAEANEQKLYVSTGVTKSPPLTISVWCKLVSNTDEALFGTTSTYRDNEILEVVSGGARYHYRQGAGYYAYGGAVATGVWTHIVGVAYANNQRRCFVNGVGGTVSTTNVNPSNDSRFICGARYYNTSGYSRFLNGELAHPCFWNCGLTESEILELYNGGEGLDPRYVRPANLGNYWDLDADLTDLVGSDDFTDTSVTGTVTATDGPVLWLPSESYFVKGAVKRAIPDVVAHLSAGLPVLKTDGIVAPSTAYLSAGLPPTPGSPQVATAPDYVPYIHYPTTELAGRIPPWRA